MGHGYGGREAPDFDLPVEDSAVLFPGFRGLSRSSRPSIPADPAGHVLHGIEVVLAVGEDDPFLDNNRVLSRLLGEKGIRHQLHVWEGRAHRASA